MNKTCIITGATDGIGKQTALGLAKIGYSMGLVGRNQEKGNQVLNEIKSATNNDSIQFFKADLAIMKNLENLSDKIKKEYSSIDMLINNAGAFFSQYIETNEGLEKTFALNHPSYFRLTELLMDILKIDKPQ